MDFIESIKNLHTIFDSLPVDLFPVTNRIDFFHRILFSNQEVILSVGRNEVSDEAVMETKKKLEAIGLFVWFVRSDHLNQTDFFIVSLKPNRQKHY